jgi:hypothetical protein
LYDFVLVGISFSLSVDLSYSSMRFDLSQRQSRTPVSFLCKVSVSWWVCQLPRDGFFVPHFILPPISFSLRAQGLAPAYLVSAASFCCRPKLFWSSCA